MDKSKQIIYLSSILRGVDRLITCLSDEDKNESCAMGASVAKFKNKFEDIFKKLFPTPEDYDIFVKTFTECNHQKEANGSLSQFVQDGDRLSCGTDKIHVCRKYRLVPIFASVGASESFQSFLSVNKLKLDEGLFPSKSCDGDTGSEKLLESFFADFKKIEPTELTAYSETLLNTLQTYASYIPVGSHGKSTINLYDQTKISAAISTCLYDACKSKEDAETKLILIGGDFSGIQSYIYQIVSKYAGKNLKGRSFYIRLLSDTIVRYVLKELSLFRANIIYNSGGGFYILAPYTRKTIETLQTVEKEIERKLFQEHGASLYLAMDYIPLPVNALLGEGMSLSEVWHSLFKKRDEKKQRKWKDVIKENYSAFFTPDNNFDLSVVDAITGEPFGKDEVKIKFDNGYIRKVTDSQIKLGTVLRDFDYIIISDTPIDGLETKLHLEPLSLGIHYYFVKSSIGQIAETLKRHRETVTIVTYKWGKGECNFLIDGLTSNILAPAFYGGNEQYDQKMVSFEKMCDNEKEDCSFKRLGVLRMDVDNLGRIFQDGMSSREYTLSHYASLSRAFDVFFSGYLNTVWNAVSPSQSCILYSGGDDLFIVGSWDVVIEFAEHIHSDFKKYACANPMFSISGGIAIVSPKFPIMKTAEISAEEESRAKSHKCGSYEKNSISIMSMPLNWEYEYPAVKKLKETVVEHIDSGKVTKSFISKILCHAANAKFVEHRLKNLKVYWMLTYDLSRMKQRSKNTSLIEHCMADVCNSNGKLYGNEIKTDYHPLELWALACRWAELELRTKGMLN